MVQRQELAIATNNGVSRRPENNNNNNNNNNSIRRNKNNRRSIRRNLNNRRSINQDSIDVITTTIMRVDDPDPTTELVTSSLRVNNPNNNQIPRVSLRLSRMDDLTRMTGQSQMNNRADNLI